MTGESACEKAQRAAVIAVVPKPKPGKAHGDWPVVPSRGEAKWPCGNDLCPACAALCYGRQSGAGRCDYEDYRGRCYMAKGHRIGGPDPDHAVLWVEPSSSEVKEDSR